MHEEALFRDLRRKLEEIARDEGAAEISRVAVWVGALSHVTEATLRSRWSTTVDGTPARTARLEVQISTDVSDPRARDVVLTHVDVVDLHEKAAEAASRPRRAHEGERPSS